jgi:predicted DNA-binding transcriptional regulator AlpA
MIPVSRSAWYQGIKDGRFPKPVKLGPGISRWRLSDVLAIVRSGV